MEKTSLVKFEENKDTSFYICRECQTHLALHQELLHKYRRDIHHGLFKNLVNVSTGAHYQIVSGQTGAQVSCLNCHTNLGAKFVALQFETSAIKAGIFIIDMKKLLFCKGNEMAYADTEEPIQSK